ncbi:MAG: hypothetical protein ACO3A4_11215 [Silvanigrellaceae bacterium]
MVHSRFLVLGLAGAVAVSSCGKKKSTAEEQLVSAVSNALAVGYPEGLSIPSFPKTTTTTAALTLEFADSDEKTLGQKVVEQQKILKGEVEDCFAGLKARLDKQRGPEELCYEFDQEMIYGYKQKGSETPKVYGTTSGLSRKTGSSEVCMVSFAREEMRDIELQIDGMLDRAQAMACLAKKNSINMTNNEADLTELMNSKRPTDRPDAPTFTSVKLKRLADKDSRPVFQTEIKSTRAGGVAEELTIVHSAASDSDNTTYNGIITVKRSGDQLRDQGKVSALSIEYARAKDGDNQKIRASVRRANFATTVTEMFDTTGRVNLQGLAQNADNNVANGISLVEFDVNQSDNSGNLVYWKNPGGIDGESARGFVFKVEKDTDGKMKGCSISGAVRGVSIRKSLRSPADASLELKPNGFYHPFFHGPNCSFDGSGDVCQNPTAGTGDYDFTRAASGDEPAAFWKKTAIAGGNGDKFVRDQTGSLVSRQCFKQNDLGEYLIDSTAGLGVAGFELIATTDPKFIAPPRLEGVKDKPLK